MWNEYQSVKCQELVDMKEQLKEMEGKISKSSRDELQVLLSEVSHKTRVIRRLGEQSIKKQNEAILQQIHQQVLDLQGIVESYQSQTEYGMPLDGV